MKQITTELAGKHIFLYGEPKSKICLLQLIGAHDKNMIDQTLKFIKEFTVELPFAFVALEIKNWNNELSPWKAPAVFGSENFGDGATQTLSYILEKLLPEINNTFELDESEVKYILGGYSLAALFALWAGYQTNKFNGIAAASPSVWFPNWDTFIQNNTMQVQKVYLSLGDQESKTKNLVLQKVAQRIQLQHEVLQCQIGKTNCTLEWYPGNHFKDTNFRKAKALTWTLNELLH